MFEIKNKKKQGKEKAMQSGILNDLSVQSALPLLDNFSMFLILMSENIRNLAWLMASHPLGVLGGVRGRSPPKIQRFVMFCWRKNT